MTHTTGAAWGVDGCKGGWFYFRFPPSPGGITFGFVTRLNALFDLGYRTAEDKAARADIAAAGDLMLVDMPIGIPDQDACQSVLRECDQEARWNLGPRWQSVFPVPVRSVLVNEHVLGAQSWKDARPILAEQHSVPDDKTGRLTAQSFAILAKIREVDDLLSSPGRAADTVRETHPEVCFWALGGEKPMEFAKAHGVGFLDRVNLLEDCRPGAKDAILRACRVHRTVGSDDIVDAMACAVTATARDDLQTLPEEPEEPSTDSKKPPMEIVYASGDAVRRACVGVTASPAP